MQKGGPVGVEMAGEISEVYFNKKIYLIQSRDFLVTEDFGEPFQTNMRKCLESAEVEVIMSRWYWFHEKIIISTNFHDF